MPPKKLVAKAGTYVRFTLSTWQAIFILTKDLHESDAWVWCNLLKQGGSYLTANGCYDHKDEVHFIVCTEDDFLKAGVSFRQPRPSKKQRRLGNLL